MMSFVFRPTTTDFRKWCGKFVGQAFSLVRSYEQWPELFEKEDYNKAKKICHQYKVLMASLTKEERAIIERSLMNRKAIHYSVEEERMAFYNAFNNWKDICFPERRFQISTVTKEQVGERIKRLRIQQGYTRQLIADVLGISEATLKAYENGDRMLRLDVAYQLTQIYACALDELFNNINQASR